MGTVKTMMRGVIVLIASILLFSANVNPAQAATDLSGIWLGTWTSLNATTYNGPIQMEIFQDGDKIVGTSLVGNTKCSPERDFKGTLSGKYDNFLNMELYSDGTPISTLWGVINRTRNSISVVYNFDSESSDCYGDVGTMFISKIQSYSKIQGVENK